MIDYLINHYDKLGAALLEHVEIVVVTLILSLIVAAALTMTAVYFKSVSRLLIHTFSVIYSIPSLALFALMIPLTGLGRVTAVSVLVIYNQYVLLRNFIAGLNEVDPNITEAATGIGMNKMQVLIHVKLPLAKKAFFAGIRLAVVTTIGMATIAAFINAGGLGEILFDGLRTLNVYKIMWGSILSAGLAIGVNGLLVRLEKRI